MIFRWRRGKKGNRHGARRPLDRNDVGGLNAAMQDMCAATEASTLGVRRLRMLLSLICGSGAKNVFLPASGKNRRNGAGRAFQLFAADLREGQISKDQEKEKENYPAMQVSSPC